MNSKFDELHKRFCRRTSKVFVGWTVEAIASLREIDPSLPDDRSILLDDYGGASAKIVEQYWKKYELLQALRLKYGIGLARRRDRVEPEIPVHQQTLRQKMFDC